MRVMAKLVNEAILCLQENVVSSAVTGDFGGLFLFSPVWSMTPSLNIFVRQFFSLSLLLLFSSFSYSFFPSPSLSIAVVSFGFPPFSGGPFRWVDTYGAQKLVDRMNSFRTQYGDGFTPCELLVQYAKEGKKFHE